MTVAVALLDELRARGLALVAREGLIHVKPVSLLTDADRVAIRTHRSDLIALLEDEARLVAAWHGLTPAERERFGHAVLSRDTFGLEVDAVLRARRVDTASVRTLRAAIREALTVNAEFTTSGRAPGGGGGD